MRNAIEAGRNTLKQSIQVARCFRPPGKPEAMHIGQCRFTRNVKSAQT